MVEKNSYISLMALFVLFVHFFFDFFFLIIRYLDTIKLSSVTYSSLKFLLSTATFLVPPPENILFITFHRQVKDCSSARGFETDQSAS